jgi:2-polyprenyl-3-methyl-5-hydroxy-6-metoxy-1,4-benzoquinol methylase
VTKPTPSTQAEHNRQTRDAYDRLAAVWAATTDDGPFNGLLERPALRSLVPGGLAGAVVLDAGCGSGAQAHWLLEQGAEVIGADAKPTLRCRSGSGNGRCRQSPMPSPTQVSSSTGSLSRNRRREQ